MRLFIPPLSTRLEIIKPWTFELLCEERNKSLWDLKAHTTLMNLIPHLSRRGNTCTVTLKPGDILIVDRIFIRKGSKQYDSITFRGMIEHMNLTHTVRFWVKLADTLNLDVEVIIP